jgi:hypothetical protein
MSTGLRAPVKGMVFQFRRFQIKDMELLIDLLRQKNYTGAGKWLGAHIAIGGIGLMRPLLMLSGGAYITLQVYNAIKEEFGETVANLIAYGLPSLLGMDFSYSLQLVDLPHGRTPQEAIGNVALGPLGSLVITGLTAAFGEQAEKGLIDDPLERALRAIGQRAPGLRWIQGLEQVWTGDYDFRDARGRLKFKGDLKDVLLNMTGFRTITAANQDLILSAYLEVRERRDRAIDRASAVFGQALFTNEGLDEAIDEALEIRDRWNTLWPEFPITTTEISRRAKERLAAGVTPQAERILRQGPKMLRGTETFEP